jgi:hypothetical protein
LSDYLADTKATVPGTKMVFPGIKKDEDRANVIDYLRTLSESPAPLTSGTARSVTGRWLGSAHEVPFSDGPAPVIPVRVGPWNQAVAGLRVLVPDDARPGESLLVSLVKKAARTGRVLGGVAVRIRVTESA